MANIQGGLVLSLFPGIGLFDRAFEEAGFCVVRGPDRLWGGDIRRFEPPCGYFSGVIGGPPCQDFSAARRAATPPTGEGVEMLSQFARCVSAAEPDWWLCENVPGVPDLRVEGYEVQRLNVEQAWFVPVRRLRCFQWGRHRRVLERTRPLDVPRRKVITPNEPCVMASESRPFEVLKRLQGLPTDFDLPGFSDEGRRRAVGNGVGLVLGNVIATAVCAALSGESQVNLGPDTQSGDLGHIPPAALSRQDAGGVTLPRCPNCRVVVTGKRVTCSDACRTALSRSRRGLLKRRAGA